MAKQTARKKKDGQPKTSKSKAAGNFQQELSGPWIPMRTGVRIIAAASIFMAVLTAWQAVPTKGWFEGILWGLLFGGMIWAIFGVFYLYGRYIRK